MMHIRPPDSWLSIPWERRRRIFYGKDAIQSDSEARGAADYVAWARGPSGTTRDMAAAALTAVGIGLGQMIGRPVWTTVAVSFAVSFPLLALGAVSIWRRRYAQLEARAKRFQQDGKPAPQPASLPRVDRRDGDPA